MSDIDVIMKLAMFGPLSAKRLIAMFPEDDKREVQRIIQRNLDRGKIELGRSLELVAVPDYARRAQS